MASAGYHRHHTVSGAAAGVRDELAATEKKRATRTIHRNDTRLQPTVPAAMSMDGLRTLGCSRIYVRDGDRVPTVVPSEVGLPIVTPYITHLSTHGNSHLHLHRTPSLTTQNSHRIAYDQAGRAAAKTLCRDASRKQTPSS